LGFVDIATHLWRKILQKPQFLGREQPFSSQTREIEKHAYYQNYCIDSIQFCTVIETNIWFVGGPSTHITNPRWRTAAILENRRITMSRPRFHRFRPNLAWRRSSALVSRPTVKNLKFKKIQMAAAVILKNGKIAMCRRWLDLSPQNLARADAV